LKIAIAGAGIVGAYLYRILSNEGVEVDLYDIRNGTTCGLTPCAWGTSNGFHGLVEATGLDPEDYLLERPDHLFIDGERHQADLMTFDKPRLIKDLLGDTGVNYSHPDPSEYDRTIDATGVARALLSPLDDDIILPCKQYRVHTEEQLENKIHLGRIGYAWCFPLSGSRYHIGCGGFRSDPQTILEKLGWMTNDASRPNRRIICSCAGHVRLTGPRFSKPFVSDGTGGQIWGVGEAIGCVAPLAGDGILTGMKSAQILMKNWDDPDAYTRAILEEFHWMTGERRVIDKLMGMDPMGLRDEWILRKNSRRMGFRIGLVEAAKYLKKLR
jgi:flavin-dependent dehydrogenase